MTVRYLFNDPCAVFDREQVTLPAEELVIAFTELGAGTLDPLERDIIAGRWVEFASALGTGGLGAGDPHALPAGALAGVLPRSAADRLPGQAAPAGAAVGMNTAPGDRRASAAAHLSALEARSPGAVELAVLSSTAVVLDVDLLRAVRLTLAPQFAADAESDLWVSEIVDSRDPLAVTIVPAVGELLRARLRARLQQDDGLARQLSTLLGQVHAALPTSLRLEESVRWIVATQSEQDAVAQVEPLIAGALTGVPTRSEPG